MEELLKWVVRPRVFSLSLLDVALILLVYRTVTGIYEMTDPLAYFFALMLFPFAALFSLAARDAVIYRYGPLEEL